MARTSTGKRRADRAHLLEDGAAITRRRRHIERASRWPAWLAAFGIAGSAVGVGFATIAPERAGSATMVPETPAAVETLRSALQRLEQCIVPKDRKALVAAFAADVDELGPAIVWVLNQPGHELFAGTATLAGELRLEVAAAPLEAAAWSNTGPARRPALEALDRLRPLPAEDLADLLHSDMRDLELAAMKIIQRRDEVPTAVLQPVLQLLSSEDHAVRTAAFAVVPERLPPEWIGPVMALIDDERAGPLVEQLLGRIDPTPDTVEALARLLGSAQPDQQQRLIQTLDRYAEQEPVRDVLWNLVAADGDLGLRTAALASLERANDTRPLPMGASQWPPSLRFQAARFRIAAGDEDGIDILLELIEQDFASDAEGRAAAGKSRLLLGQLSKLPPHAPTQDFVSWFAEREGSILDRSAFPAAPSGR